MWYKYIFLCLTISNVCSSTLLETSSSEILDAYGGSNNSEPRVSEDKTIQNDDKDIKTDEPITKLLKQSLIDIDEIKRSIETLETGMKTSLRDIKNQMNEDRLTRETYEDNSTTLLEDIYENVLRNQLMTDRTSDKVSDLKSTGNKTTEYINDILSGIKNQINLQSKQLSKLTDITSMEVLLLDRLITTNNGSDEILQGVLNTTRQLADTETPPNIQVEHSSRLLESKVTNAHKIDEAALLPLWGSGGRCERLGLAVEGDGSIYIYLSREPRVDLSPVENNTTRNDLFFRLVVRDTFECLYCDDAGVLTLVPRTAPDADISSLRDTRLTLAITNDSVAVYVGSATTPLLSGKDPRFREVRYIGFESHGNTLGFAVFKCNC